MSPIQLYCHENFVPLREIVLCQNLVANHLLKMFWGFVTSARGYISIYYVVNIDHSVESATQQPLLDLVCVALLNKNENKHRSLSPQNAQHFTSIIGRAGASPPSRTTGPRCLYIYIYILYI